MMNQELFDISLEEFDEMNEKHIFSKKYNRKKKKLLQDYKRSLAISNGSNYVKAAAAFALVLVAAPIVANAASNGEMFSRIWGTQGKDDVASHDEVVYDEEGNSVTVTYPERDYQDMDVEKAEELIGNQVAYQSITKELGETTLTILSAVRDNNSAVVEFTLEKEGGVDALNYSQLDNEAKGAWFSDSATFWFKIGTYGGNIFVDLDKSTDDKLYCYDYVTLESASSSNISMELYEYPCTRAEYIEASQGDSKYGEIVAETKHSFISIPISENVESAELTNADGGAVEISPISIKIDMSAGLGLTESQAADPYYCYYVSINYKDGTNYIVKENNTEEHSCDVEIDNSSYGCGTMNNEMIYVFNRLVDTEQVESVTVNDVEYTLQ